MNVKNCDVDHNYKEIYSLVVYKIKFKNTSLYL